MTTLNDLIEEYGAEGFVIEDDGNGCAYPKYGMFMLLDEECRAEYGDVPMVRLTTAHISADNLPCEWKSDWLIKGEGDNPYRVRLFF